MGILVAWLTATLGLWVSSKVLARVQLASFVDAIWAGALLGILQWALLGPIFVMLGIGTLGIGFLLWFVTRWVASAIVIMLASALSSRLRVEGFVAAFVTALIVSVTGSVVRLFV
jgi:uncharacterized membrane protein YvlD (DUF360 family)